MTRPAATIVMQLTNRGSMREFSVRHASDGGWEVREEIDERPVRISQYLDWHRVERAIALIDRRAEALQQDGWVLNQPFHAAR